MPIDYKRAYKFFMKRLCSLTVTNIVTMRKLEVVCDRFNVVGTYTNRNYAQN